MARPATRVLTSEERCHRAFEEWANQLEPRMDNQQKATFAFAWQACWHYLERQVRTEFIEQ
jgi:hypothetical protein